MNKQIKRAKETINILNTHINDNEELIVKINKYIRIAKDNYDYQSVTRLEDNKRELKAITRGLKQSKKEIMLAVADCVKIDKSTIDAESPMVKIGRILEKDFQVTNLFGTVNTQVLKKHLDTNVSTNKIHKAVLQNMPDVKFRAINNGYLYTLNYKNGGFNNE